MIVEFEDKYKRSIVLDTRAIVALVENIEYTTSGTDHRKDGTWSVVLDNGKFLCDVSEGMKNTIKKVWEDNHA